MYNKACIHCGRKMSCDDGVAHHKCSRLAQEKIEKLEKELKDEIKTKNIFYRRLKEGEWVQPIRRGYHMQCCDCGLLHKLNFRVIKDKIGRVKIQFQAFRVTKKGERK